MPILLGMIAILASAAGQTPRSAASADDEIIVEGHTLNNGDIARAVGAISHPEPTGGFDSQYARWSGRICVMVAGFPRDGGQFIADRIGVVARDVRLDAGAPGCSPNIFIIATDDPAKMIAMISVKRQGLVDGADLAVLRRVRESHDPVRWIGAISMAGGAGEAIVSESQGSMVKPVAVSRSFAGGSRLVAQTQTVLKRETIIVDTRQIGGITYGQLADYLSFVALAQINPHVVPQNVDSIVTAFAKRGSGPAGLTAFDKAYLTGLYRSPAAMVGAVQKGVIEATISQTLRPDDMRRKPARP